MSQQSASGRYLVEAATILERISSTQVEAIDRAAAICAASIAAGGLVHAFGTGHSRIPVEELFPRHGSFPGFHPIVELSLTNHTQIVGANGQRQAMWLEKVEGFGDVILRNFNFGQDDAMIVFSNSGVNAVVAFASILLWIHGCSRWLARMAGGAAPSCICNSVPRAIGSITNARRGSIANTASACVVVVAGACLSAYARRCCNRSNRTTPGHWISCTTLWRAGDHFARST